MGTGHPRIVEYRNPRPLILGICFVCGVVSGFFLYLFRAPEPPPEPTRALVPAARTEPNPADGRSDRLQGLPNIAPVDPEPDGAASLRLPALENFEIVPPPPVVTTEGGLTGLTAKPLEPSGGRSRAPAAGAASPPGRPAVPPPLPDLMP